MPSGIYIRTKYNFKMPKNFTFKGRHHTEETKKIMSNIFKGKLLSDEHKKKISEIHKGMKHTEETKKKMSESKMGKKHSEGTKRKISKANKGRNHYFYDKHHTEETKRKISQAEKGKKVSNETKIKMSAKAKLNWQNFEIRNKTVKAALRASYIKPNKVELQLQNILNGLYPNDWQYVGNGKVILGGFCPDFININGKKQIIEMNGDYWHNRQGAAEKDKHKIETYKQLGYKTLTVWEHELKDTKRLENKIQEFCTC